MRIRLVPLPVAGVIIFNPEYATYHMGREIVPPCQPQACAEAARATKRAAAATAAVHAASDASNTQYRVLFPQVRWPFCCCSWPSRGEPLSRTQHHPRSQLSSPPPMRHASTDSNLRGGAPHTCGRSLLHVCLAAAAVAVASYWYGVCFVGRSTGCASDRGA